MKLFATGFLNIWIGMTELHGCGAFTASSFGVFYGGDYNKVLKEKKADCNVKAYAAPLERMYS